jgi:DNA invertase Pin-like site-specific DNA recombinase
MTSDSVTRAALYARISTRDKGQDVENQLTQLREFAARQGWAIVHEFIDRESGSTADRTEFQSMFHDASQRKFDLLLFWSLDRLSREGVLETLQHLNRLTSYGVNYRSFTEQYFDSCGIFKDAVISILATIAKQERIRISERVRAGLDRARSKGKRLGRPRVSPDASKITALREAGRSWPQIAKQLGVGVGTVYRSYQELSKNSALGSLSRNPISRPLAAD